MSHKLVLGSGGIFFENDSDPIIDHIISLTEDKPEKKAVYLPTGGRDIPDEETDRTVASYFLTHGFSSCVSLYLTHEETSPEYIRDTILTADVIYARGGNLKFILDAFRSTGADKLLRRAYDNGTVIAGESSGAMCWVRRGYDDCGPDGAYVFLDALDFAPYILCPHFEDWQCFLDDVKPQDLDALALDNDIAISVVDGKYSIIDSHRNPRHSAFYLPKSEGFAVHDLQKEHIGLRFE